MSENQYSVSHKYICDANISINKNVLSVIKYIIKKETKHVILEYKYQWLMTFHPRKQSNHIKQFSL